MHADGETHSVVDLKKAGMYRYFEDPTTDVWCLSAAIENGPIIRWKKGQDCPHEIGMHIEAGRPIVAHNAGFERQLFAKKLGPKYGFPVPHLEQFYCTAAMAAAMALPRDLSGVAMALGLAQQKDMEGRRIMLQLARPRLTSDGSLAWWDTHPDGPAKLEKLYDYCDQDVFTERAAEEHLRPLSPFERDVWLLDQRINERGVPIDVANVQHARWVLHHHTQRFVRRLAQITNGAVTTGGQVAKLRAWLAEQGVDLTSLGKNAVTKALKELDDADDEIDVCDIDEAVAGVQKEKRAAAREALQIRQELAKSSVKKLDAFEDRCSQDRRARDNLMYAAASTLRWGGRGIQLQNMPRKATKKIVNPVTGQKKAVEILDKYDVDWAFDMLHHRDPSVFEHTIGSPPLVIADMLKGFIKAPPGYKFVKGDYSNIEGRVAAWLAEEHWKVRAFEAADRKEGPDIYLLTASKVTGIDVASLNKESPERQMGKVCELSCQFGGGVGAFQTNAVIYDIEITDAHAKNVVTAWREEHPAIVEYWDRIERAMLHVVRNGGKASLGKVAFAFKTGFMWLRKPNGEYLCYVDPRIRLTRRVKFEDGFAFSQVANAEGVFVDPNFKRFKTDETKYVAWEVQVPEHEAVTVMSVNSQTRKWERVGLYGGLVFENIVQAIARDCMVNGMFNLEAAGYPIILTVHDEAISEVASDFGSAKEFELLMVSPAEWMAGLPIRAEADECVRYRK